MENGNLQFLDGGGEMGSIIRAKDWSETAVGNPDSWPQSLRTALSIILYSKFPMFLFWGKELTCFYNDDFRPSLGNDGKHPSILGMTGELAWPETWEFIKPLIDQVIDKKEATWHEDQLLPIFRNGKIEDAYWTFSYSPFIDETGKPAGIFVTCTETTDKIMLMKTLQDNSEQLAFAIEAAEMGTYDYSPITGKFTANARLKNWFGLPDNHEINLQDAINAVHEDDRQKLTDAITDAMTYGSKSNGRIELQYAISYPERPTPRIVLAKAKTTFNEDHVAIRIDGTLFDITKQVEESKHKDVALEQVSTTAKHLALALDAGKLGAYELDLETGKITCSQQCKANFGKTIDESMSYEDLINMILPEDLPVMQEGVQRSLSSNVPYDVTYRIKVDDEIRWIHASGLPMLNANGNIIGMAGVTANITEQKNSQLKINAAHEEIALTSEKLNIVIESSELGTWDLNFKTGTIISSHRFAQIFGYDDVTEFSAEKAKSFVHPDDIESRAEAYSKAFETGIMNYAGRIILEDGSLRWVESRGKVFFDTDGKPDYMIGTLRDITEERQKQHKLTKSEQKFRLLADSMPQHIWTSDIEGNLNYFNKSVFDYSGLTSEQIHTDGLLQIVHPDEREANIKAWQKSIETGADFNFEHRFRKADGEYRWQLSRAVPQRDHEGGIQMWVGTSTDIQDQRSFTEALEQSVQERTQQLSEKNLELEEINKELQTFAYISSHDLQEPLRKIQTFAGLITSGESDGMSPKAKDYLHRMQKAAARMQTLISDLLTYSRTNSSEKIFEPFDFCEIINEVIDEVAEELEQSDGKITVDGSCKFHIIHYQFRQLLHNLISNSLKFKREGVPPVIKITCKTLEKGADVPGLNPELQYHWISYEDNGIGFDQKYADKIFGLFQRLHGKSDYEGTGIGLSIVKKIIDNHSGLITAEGKENKGATFNIYLPVTE